jgi:glycosyltransferase involved in cell wall biosynthesis
MEARRRLPDEPLPMRITCWGAAESVETRRLPAGVTVEPAYGPDETATVMRSLDALVVPSLMRESFSIVAREALLAGVPVICSDSGGPEEVVHHGSNGLVVESGNPAAWAAALARWSGDPQLRQRLSRGAGARPAGVIDLTGQAAHLEQVYAGLPVPPRPKAATPAAPPDLLIISGIEGAPLRYRAHQLAAAHRALGGRITLLDHRHRRIPEAISTGGLVVFYRVPWSTWTRTCVEAAQGRGAHVVFSVDDLIFTPELRDRIPAVRSLPPTEAEQWMEGVRRYQDTARACGVVLASTPAIAEAAKAQGLVAAIQPNGLSTETALLSQAALWCTREERAERRAGGVVRMGYLSGTTTHDTDWAMIEPAIAKVLQEREDAELWLIGPVRVGADLDQHPRVRRIGFRPYQELPRVQAELDIVLAPLEPDLEFSEAKSAVKWVEAAACRIPVVASPTGPFRTAIEHGVTGVLAGPTDWYDQVDHLAGDADAREQIGRAARADVYLRHGPAALAEAWARTYPKLLEARPANLVAAALPSAAQDEHPTVPSLEPEPSGGYLDAQPTPAVRTSSRLGGAAVLETTLQCRYPRLCRVDIRTATFGASAVAELELELRDGARVVRQGRIGPDAIADDGWTAWAFDPATTSGGPELTLRLTQPEAPAGRGIAWWASDESTLCVRTWAYAGRDEICAFAMGASAGRSAAYRRPNAAIALWHKGRHSLASQGASATSQRVVRYVRRWWRGRRARRRTGS